MTTTSPLPTGLFSGFTQSDTPTQGLPEEVLGVIVDQLNPIDYAHLSQVCRGAKHALADSSKFPNIWMVPAMRLGYHHGQADPPGEFFFKTLARVKECQERGYYKDFERVEDIEKRVPEQKEPSPSLAPSKSKRRFRIFGGKGAKIKAAPSTSSTASQVATCERRIVPSPLELSYNLAEHAQGNQLSLICPWIPEGQKPPSYLPLNQLSVEDAAKLQSTAMKFADIILGTRALSGIDQAKDKWVGNLLLSLRKCNAPLAEPMRQALLHVEAGKHPAADGAMNWAIQELRFDLVLTLVEAGADPNYRHRRNEPPLNQVIEYQRNDCIPSLISLGADVNRFSPECSETSPTCMAILSQNLPAIQILAEAGANLNAVGCWVNYRWDRHLLRPLELAAFQGSIPLIQALLKAGASFELGTPLAWAVLGGQTEVIQTFLEAGAPINQVSEKGETCLMTAIHQGRWEIVKLLIERGADTQLADSMGKTPWGYAIEGSCERCVEALMEAGARPVLSDLLKTAASRKTPEHLEGLFNPYFTDLEAKHPDPIKRLNAIQSAWVELVTFKAHNLRKDASEGTIRQIVNLQYLSDLFQTKKSELVIELIEPSPHASTLKLLL